MLLLNGILTHVLVYFPAFMDFLVLYFSTLQNPVSLFYSENFFFAGVLDQFYLKVEPDGIIHAPVFSECFKFHCKYRICTRNS